MLNFAVKLLMLKKNILTISVALVIAVLSLTGSDTLGAVKIINFSGFDKIAHFLMYFCLMSVVIFENTGRLKKSYLVFLTGIIPLLYGLILELLQAFLTTTRSGSVYDFLCNGAGILFSILAFLAARKFGPEKFRY